MNYVYFLKDVYKRQFETLGSNEGYVVEVPVNGSSDLSSYVKATDNVDGDVDVYKRQALLIVQLKEKVYLKKNIFIK